MWYCKVGSHGLVWGGGGFSINLKNSVMFQDLDHAHL